MENAKLNSILLYTVYASLFIQIATGMIDLYVVLLPTIGELVILKKMLQLELFVQIVEGTFYTWLASISSRIKNITPNRYYDWAITTPVMLFTFCLYLDYLGEHDKNTKESLLSQPDVSKKPNESPDGTKPIKDMTLWEYLSLKKGILLPILALNWVMLIFGYLGEIGDIHNILAVICGFIPFILYFAIIYYKFAKHTSTTGQIIFWIFFSIWSLYGMAALATYYWKNIAYNILDLFAKNFFGIILAYTLYTHL